VRSRRGQQRRSNIVTREPTWKTSSSSRPAATIRLRGASSSSNATAQPGNNAHGPLFTFLAAPHPPTLTATQSQSATNFRAPRPLHTAHSLCAGSLINCFPPHENGAVDGDDHALFTAVWIVCIPHHTLHLPCPSIGNGPGSESGRC
jgi:hypothetical protein